MIQSGMTQTNVSQNTNTAGTSLSDASLNVERPLEMGAGTLSREGGLESFSYEIGQPDKNGLSSLTIDAGSPASNLLSALGIAASRFFRNPAVGVAATAIGLGTINNTAQASLIHDGADRNANVTLGAAYSGRLVWITGTNASGTQFRVSGTLIDPWNVLTSGHGVPSTGSGGTIDAVGTGANRFTDPGTITGATGWSRYPTYTGGFGEPDLAIIHLSSPISISTIGFSAASIGSTVISAGFGRWGMPSTGLQPDDGSSMGWLAPVLSYNPSNVSSNFFSTDFDPSNGVSLNGKGQSGDSGGPVFDSAGQLVGITVGQFGGLSPLGGTVVQRLDLPDVQTWWNANAVPEPAGIVWGVAGLGLMLRRRR